MENPCITIANILKAAKNDNTFIYRIQSESAAGPYYFSAWRPQEFEEDVHSTRPLLSDEQIFRQYDLGTAEILYEIIDLDIQRRKKAELLFAFSSLEKLYSWFPEKEMKALEAIGQTIVCIEVASSWNFGKQSLFFKSDIIREVYRGGACKEWLAA